MPRGRRLPAATMAAVGLGAAARRAFLRGGVEVAATAALAGLSLGIARSFGAPFPFPISRVAVAGRGGRPPRAGGTAATQEAKRAPSAAGAGLPSRVHGPAAVGVTPAPTGLPVELHFFGASPAQAVLVIARPEAALVGGGSQAVGEEALRRLRAAGIARLAAVLVTGGRPGGEMGLAAIIEAVPVGQIMEAAAVVDLAAGIAALARRRGIRVRDATRGGELDVAGVRLEWLWPPEPLGQPGEAAATPGLVAATSGSVRFLLAGGLRPDDEERLVRMGGDLRAQVLEVPAGGAGRAVDPSFLRAVSPRVAIVGDTSERPADPSLVAQLAASGVLVLHGDAQSDLTVGTDGRRIAVAFDPGPVAALPDPAQGAGSAG